MSTFQQLTPSDGQVFVDSYYVSWQWNIEDQLWHRLGNLNGIPVADENTIGLLSSSLKSTLDSVAYAGGGFGIILSKPAATVFGDIILRSESFDIQPIDAFGNVVETSTFTSSDDTVHSPGFRLSVSEEYLRSFCVEFVGPTGPEGAEGEIGDKGLDGFNDSPRGHFGLAGFNADGFVTFSGIKFVDIDDLTSKAVVNVQFDTVDNAVVVTKSEMNVANDDVPAEQFAAVPITRHLQFALGEGDCKSTLDDWSIIAPTDDALAGNPDVYLLSVPDSVQVDDVVIPQFAKLSDVINGITSVYKKKLQDCDNQWLKEARDFISSKDGLARTALSNLAQKLAECEFERPLEFSLGIIPPVPSVPLEPSVPPTGSVLDRTLILAIYDESLSNYVVENRETGVYEELGTYYADDKVLWEGLIDRVKFVFRCRLGLVQTTYDPRADYLIPPNRGMVYDTDGTSRLIQYDEATEDLSDPNWIRVSPQKLLSAYNSACDGGYVPTFVIFLMDNSGSMRVDDHYGTPPPNPGDDPGSLVTAKELIRAQNPNVIFLNTLSNSGERWVLDAYTALQNIITESGVSVP